MGRKKKAESKPTKDTENVKDAFSVELGIGDLATKLRTESMGVRMSTMSRYRDLVRRKVENIPYDRPEEKKNKEFNHGKWLATMEKTIGKKNHPMNQT